MLIYLPVPDLLISWLKSHKSAFARSLWFRVSIRLAIFFMTKCKNTLNLCLFVFCLFLWLLGCGFFLCSHTCWNTQWRSDDVIGVYIPTDSSTPGTDRKEERPVAGFSVGCGVFLLFVFCFFPRPAHHTCQVKTVVPHRHLLRYVQTFNSFVTWRSHFTSSQTRYWPLFFNWICSK